MCQCDGTWRFLNRWCLIHLSFQNADSSKVPLTGYFVYTGRCLYTLLTATSINFPKNISVLTGKKRQINPNMMQFRDKSSLKRIRIIYVLLFLRNLIEIQTLPRQILREHQFNNCWQVEERNHQLFLRKRTQKIPFNDCVHHVTVDHSHMC